MKNASYANDQNTLTCTLIGRFINRYSSLSLRDNTVVTLRKGVVENTHDLSKFTEFSTFQKGLFGGVLTLLIEGKRVKLSWLNNQKAVYFTHHLNTSIANTVHETISPVIETFDEYIVNQFPRDSRFEQISRLINSLHHRYSSQRELWDKYFEPKHLDKIGLILRFHPLDLERVRKFHEKLQLKKRSDFFDLVESNPLTEEQRLGVLRSNDLNMVLAAAGTGKTSVIVAKALDLIERKLAKPEQILILAYNKAAADELNERLLDKAKSSNVELHSFPQISTFHALGRKILRESGVSTYMSVFAEDNIKFKQWTTQWIEDYLVSDVSKLLDFISLFPESVNPFDFKDQTEYESYVRDNEFRTLKGEKVKGYQELQIANYLYVNGIAYTYEAPYVSKRRIDIGFDYRPDFLINDANVYLEHYGIDRNGNTRPDIDAQKYNESIDSKRILHEEFETKCIETFHYEWVEGVLLTNLEEKLLVNEIEFKPLVPDAILDELRESGRIGEWSGLFGKALQAIRVERLSKDDMLSRFKKAKISKPVEFSNLLDELHQAYVQELKDQNCIDFDDMIIRTIDVIRNGTFSSTWDYILVDEFQDISASRMEFVKALLEKGNGPSLTVVGDDWQSIYRFSGGKLELTTRFDEMVGSYSSTKLQKTFRYNSSIADTAGNFIMENPEQYKKYIGTHTKVEESQVYLLDDKIGVKDGLYQRVVEVITKIRERDSGSSISVIARYNYLLDDTRQALSNAGLKNKVNFWSYHKSKGLEADYCVLIGFFQGRSGFPNENKSDAIIEALLPSLDDFPHSEERRLLYVGITRAKKAVYIIADPTAPSEFITELLAPKYDINIVSEKFQKQHQEIFKCPNCEEGYLRMVKGPYGEFYSCSTGRGCRVGKARICEKCRAPSIDTRSASICNNSACGNSFRICEKCGRPMRKRKRGFGEFWGCSGYGIKGDQCKHTVN
jgi:DNA helicase-4